MVFALRFFSILKMMSGKKNLPAFFLVILFLLPFDAWAKKKPDPFEEFKGKTIRNITINVREIFDGPDLGTLYTTVNSVKVSTREKVVRRELLFKEGDSFDVFTVRESERILRTLRALRNVEIRPRVDREFVDVEVSVQDTWSLIPRVDYSTGSGTQKKFIGLAESNLLGLGKRAEIGYQEDDQRQSWQAVWDDPRLMGTAQRLAGAYIQRSDGEKVYFNLDRPFRSFLDSYSWGLEGRVDDTIGRIFRHGDEYYIFRQKIDDISAGYTISPSERPDQEVSRYTIGWDFQNYRFFEAKAKDYEDLDLDPEKLSHDPVLLPGNRKFSGPVLQYRYIEPDFISLNYVDRFDRTEDYNLGQDFTARLTIAPEFLASSCDALLMTTNYARGYKMARHEFVRGEIGLSSRLQSDGLQNSLIRHELRHYKIFQPLYVHDMFLGRHTLASGFRFDYGWKLDKDRQFLLGADTGLRGYEARSYAGEKRILLNVEDRIHIAEDIWRLISLGGVIFGDIGSASSDSLGEMFKHRLYNDFGVGLRMAFPRSSGGQVLRVDFAFPTRDDADTDTRAFEVRVVFAAGQMFNSRLSSEIVGSEAANVGVGFDR